MFRNNSFGTATSADWNVTYRPWRTALVTIKADTGAQFNRMPFDFGHGTALFCSNFRPDS